MNITILKNNPAQQSSWRYVVLFILSVITFLFAARAQAIQITVTIPPLASMVAPLLDEEDRIEILLQEGMSPHGFSLKPSHLRKMQQADINLAVGTPVDAWAQKALQKFSQSKLILAALPELEYLPIRQGGLWEKKVPHADHSSDSHASHDANKSPLSFDGHLWMSIHNSKLFIRAFAETLQTLQPEKTQAIETRLIQWLNKIELAEADIKRQLKEVKSQPYMVLHDGFQYFEKHFGLNGIGSIRLNPEVQPSIKRILQLREKLQENQARCIFREPQFPDKQIKMLAKGSKVRIGELDPMGTTYQSKPNQSYVLYDRFIRQLADGFYQCLSDKK